VQRTLKKVIEEAARQGIEITPKFLQGMLIGADGLTRGLLIKALGKMPKEVLDKMVNEAVLGALKELLPEIANQATKEVVQQAITQLQKVITQASQQAIAQTTKTAIAQTTKTAIAQTTKTAIEKTSVSTWKVMLYKGLQGATYGAVWGALSSAIEKYNKALSRFLATGGALLAAEFTGLALSKATGIVFDIPTNTEQQYDKKAINEKTRMTLDQALSKELKEFSKQYLVSMAGTGVETAFAMAGIQEAGIVFSAGLTRLLQQTLYKDPQLISKLGKDNAELGELLATLEKARNNPDKLTPNEKELLTKYKIYKEGDIDWERLTQMIPASRALIESNNYKIKMAGMTTSQAMLRGLGFGLISVLLQRISLSTKSPVHGAYVNLFVSSLVRATLMKNVFTLPEGADLKNMDTPALTQLAQKHKDFSFYEAQIGVAGTYAVADMMSMGRGTPELTADGKFSLNMKGMDVFFMARYSDYIWDVHKYGFNAALTNQLLSSIHYQSVSNVTDILQHVLYKANLAKTSPLNEVYVKMPRQSIEELSVAFKVVKEQAQKLGYTGKDPKAIKEELEAKQESLKDEDKSLLVAINNYDSLKQKFHNQLTLFSQWKILEESHGGVDVFRNLVGTNREYPKAEVVEVTPQTPIQQPSQSKESEQSPKPPAEAPSQVTPQTPIQQITELPLSSPSTSAQLIPSVYAVTPASTNTGFVKFVKDKSEIPDGAILYDPNDPKSPADFIIKDKDGGATFNKDYKIYVCSVLTSDGSVCYIPKALDQNSPGGQSSLTEQPSSPQTPSVTPPAQPTLPKQTQKPLPITLIPSLDLQGPTNALALTTDGNEEEELSPSSSNVQPQGEKKEKAIINKAFEIAELPLDNRRPNNLLTTLPNQEGTPPAQPALSTLPQPQPETSLEETAASLPPEVTPPAQTPEAAGTQPGQQLIIVPATSAEQTAFVPQYPPPMSNNIPGTGIGEIPQALTQSLPPPPASPERKTTQEKTPEEVMEMWNKDPNAKRGSIKDPNIMETLKHLYDVNPNEAIKISFSGVEKNIKESSLDKETKEGLLNELYKLWEETKNLSEKDKKAAERQILTIGAVFALDKADQLGFIAKNYNDPILERAKRLMRIQETIRQDLIK